MLRWTTPWAVGSLPESGRPPDDPGKQTTCSFNSNARGENSAAEGLERTFCFRDQKNRDHAVPLYGEMAGATRSTRSRVVISDTEPYSPAFVLRPSIVTDLT
jgi:hypothetical protein